MPVDGVLAEDERRRDLAVREPGGDEAQHLGLAAAERRVAVRRCAGASSRNPASARWTSRWSSSHGRCASPASATKRAFGSIDASSRPWPIGTVRSPRRWRTRAGIVKPGDRVERPQSARARGTRRRPRRSPPGGGGASPRLSRRHSMRDEEPGEHLRGERPVQPRELHQRATRDVRHVPPGHVAAEEDDLAYTLWRSAREARRREARARAREDRRRLFAARVEHGSECARLRLRRRRGRRGLGRRVPRPAGRSGRRGAPARAPRRTPAPAGPPTPPRDARPSVRRRRATAPLRRSRTRCAGRRARRSGCSCSMARECDGPLGPCQQDGPSRGSPGPCRALTIFICTHASSTG